MTKSRHFKDLFMNLFGRKIVPVTIIIIFWWGIFLPVDSGSTEKTLFTVQKGEDVFGIGRDLESQRLVKSQWLFDLAVYLQLGQNRLQAGNYYLGPNLNVWKMTQKIITGDVAKETITIPEGWNLAEINSYLKGKNLFIDDPNLEGYLFPDTYEIKVGEGVEVLIGMMRKNFEQKLTPELRREIARQGKALNEIIIMASLLEEELKTKEDKELASDILWRRLAIGMRLQVDASSKYGADYDTYKYAGLPPGAITNPGLESIVATIYPRKNDSWYYLSTPEGETIFSQTLEQHNVAVAKYLRR